VNSDQAASHTIERVTLYGSLTDPNRLEVGDVDLLVYARRRRCRASPEVRDEPTSPDAGKCRMWLSEDEAVALRVRLEELLQAGDERLDTSVVDESSENWRPLPAGAAEVEVFRRDPSPSAIQ
jgi:hypothetical protein